MCFDLFVSFSNNKNIDQFNRNAIQRTDYQVRKGYLYYVMKILFSGAKENKILVKKYCLIF